MRALYWIVALMLFCALAVPAAAQRGGAGRGGRDGRLTGRVITVQNRQARIAIYVKADSPDAPGKVPDHLAAKAADLENLANQLAQKGKLDAAQKNRDLANELRCWREVEQTVGNGVSVAQLTNSSLRQIPQGTHLRMDVGVEDAGNGGFPARVVLLDDASQVSQRIPSAISRLGRGGRDGNAILRMIGDVVSASPLTVAVDESNVVVDNPKSYQYWQIVPMQVQNLRANQRIIVRAQANGTVVDRVQAIVVSDAENLLDIDDIF